MLEAIVALPTDMFYNTGIATYVWVLSNKKAAERRGKVQLINGVHLYRKMRKSLGSTWQAQQALLHKAEQLQAEIGTEQCDDFNAFEGRLRQALKQTGIKLDTKERKQLLDAVTWTNPDAEPIIKKLLKPTARRPPRGPCTAPSIMFSIFRSDRRIQALDMAYIFSTKTAVIQLGVPQHARLHMMQEEAANAQ